MNQPDDEIRITLRLTASLRDRLTTKAHENERSMNGEIIARLEQTLQEAPEALPPITAEIFDQLFSRLDQIDKKIDKKDQK